MKILLAIDGSPHSRAALREVGTHVWPHGTEVRVVTVDTPMGESTLGRGAPGSSVYDEIVRKQREETHALLAEAASTLRTLAPRLEASLALLEGSPAEQIVEEAHRWGANLVVLGSQGRGALMSALLGSVSKSVVLNAPCSVLVVRHAPHGGAAAG